MAALALLDCARLPRAVRGPLPPAMVSGRTRGGGCAATAAAAPPWSPWLRRMASGGRRAAAAANGGCRAMAAAPAKPPAFWNTRGRLAPPPSAAQAQAAPTEPAATFKQTGLNKELVAAAEAMGIDRPTEVQTAAIPLILKRQHDVLVASHTGSGKTLAYLLPIVQALRDEEMALSALSPAERTQRAADKAFVGCRPRRPRAVVVAPTRELAEQIFHVAKLLSHHARFRTALFVGGRPLKAQHDALARAPIDILIATPKRLFDLHNDEKLFFGDAKVAVLDEADTLLSAGFDEVKTLFDRMRHPDLKTVLVSATVTPAVQKLLQKTFPNAKHARTKTLHQVPHAAKHKFVRVPGDVDKLQVLADLVAETQGQSIRHAKQRCLVFCNKIDSCRAASHHLSEEGLRVVCHHGEVPKDERARAFADFVATPEDGRPAPALVCTDLAARGMDFGDVEVSHVILFDFPLNTVEYLHRTGRTARAGKPGRVTSLVTKRDRILAFRIEEAIRNGKPLDSLSATHDPENMARARLAKQGPRRGTRGAARLGRGTAGGRGSAGRGSAGRGSAGRGSAGRGSAGRGSAGRGSAGRGSAGRGSAGRGRGDRPNGGR